MKDLVSDGFAQVVKPYIDAQDKTTREILAPVETDETDASRAYQIGDQLILGGILYDVIAPISQHGIITSTGSGANIEESDNITEQIKSVNSALTNQVKDMNNMLGAKNLLPNEAVTQTVNGITFTVNSDGSITANGTATTVTRFYIFGSDSPVSFKSIEGKGPYKVSGVSGGDASNTYGLIFQGSNNGTTTAEACDLSDGEDIIGDYPYYRCYIIARENAVLSNVTFYPMIRPASIADGTYVPYAMTNWQLSNALEVNTGVSGLYAYKVGRVVTLSFEITTITSTSGGWNAITTLPQELAPIGGHLLFNLYDNGVSTQEANTVLDAVINSSNQLSVWLFGDKLTVTPRGTVTYISKY